MRSLHQDNEFRCFASRFVPTLLRAAYVLVGDLDLAEDAVQVTMLRVFRRWDRAREHPEAYSRSALINVCRDHWRRSQRRPTEVQLSAAIDSASAEPFDEQVLSRETLKSAIRELPHPQREVLVLRFFFDLTLEQTADVLGIPEGTAKSASSRGLKRLRAVLSSKYENETC